MVMRLSILRAAVLFFSLPACAFSASNVVNLSHYDMMRPDFAAMKREGIIGVIHEATYPPLVRERNILIASWQPRAQACFGELITTPTRAIRSVRLIIF